MFTWNKFCIQVQINGVLIGFTADKALFLKLRMAHLVYSKDNCPWNQSTVFDRYGIVHNLAHFLFRDFLQSLRLQAERLTLLWFPDQLLQLCWTARTIGRPMLFQPQPVYQADSQQPWNDCMSSKYHCSLCHRNRRTANISLKYPWSAIRIWSDCCIWQGMNIVTLWKPLFHWYGCCSNQSGNNHCTFPVSGWQLVTYQGFDCATGRCISVSWNWKYPINP